MKIHPTNFMGFHGVFMPPTLPHTPIANDVKIKEFIRQRWEQKRTLLRIGGL